MFVLLKHVGKALLNVIGGGIAGELLFDALPEVAKQAFESWSGERDQQRRRAEIEELAQAAFEEVRQQVADIKRELNAARSPQIDLVLESYLTQVPALVRKSLRRPSDPSGTTAAADLVPQTPEDLLRLLPPALPRFKRGDHPLAGVDWELVELLGVGGFGEVWKARNPHLRNAPPAALKFCLNPEAAKVLRNEAAVLDRVMREGRHPGIVHLQHTYLRAETPCLEYEYVEGGDLAGLIREWHRDGQRPKPERAAEVVHRLAEIVGFAHRLTPPIVHRDLKPANILMRPKADGGVELKVADFGIGGVASRQAAQQEQRGVSRATFLVSAVRGSYTPLYASPQQMRGESPDPRDDVFAVGVIWHQLLTGDTKTGRPGGSRWTRRLGELGVDQRHLDLLAGCFEEDREDRPRDLRALVDELAGLLPAVAAGPRTAGTQQSSGPPPQAIPVAVAVLPQGRFPQAIPVPVDAQRGAQQEAPVAIPAEVVAQCRRHAAKQFPDDFSTQAYVFEQQIEGYRRLFKPVRGLPPEAVAECRRHAAKQFPDDFSTQAYVFEQQIEGYRRLHGLAPSEAPQPADQAPVARKRSKKRERRQAQEDQTKDVQALAARVPTDVLGQIRAAAAKRWPDCYEYQAEWLVSELKGYLAMYASPPPGVPEAALAQIRAAAAKQWPDCYEYQAEWFASEVEGYLKVHGGGR